MKQILIASMEERDIEIIRQCFADEYIISTTRDNVGFKAAFAQHPPDVAFIDIQIVLNGRQSALPHDYFQEMQELWKTSHGGSIIIVTPQNLLREAVKAVKAGASNYLTSPVDQAEVKYVTESLQEFEIVQMELDYLRDRFWKDDSRNLIQTQSALMQEAIQKIKMVAQTNTTVLLTGETGVGKSTMAKLIHRHSDRCDHPFISVHCGAIPDSLIESELFGHEKGAFTGAVRRKLGKFEIANTGTIFLDEVGVLTPAAQIKLLGVIQERVFQRVGGEKDIDIDVRIIGASNIDLKILCDQGVFRTDLYYRLNVFPIEIPPLRQRKEDIRLLTKVFLKRLSQVQQKGIVDVTTEVADALCRYHWPGNVREFENIIERAFILERSSVLTPNSFPKELFSAASSESTAGIDTSVPLAQFRQQQIDIWEKRYLEELMRLESGRIKDAAETAGMSVRQLHNLMKKHSIRKERFKTGAVIAEKIGNKDADPLKI